MAESEEVTKELEDALQAAREINAILSRFDWSLRGDVLSMAHNLRSINAFRRSAASSDRPADL